MQTIWPILLAALLAGAVIMYFYQEHIRERRLLLRVKKLYASQLFEDMLPMLRNARRHAIELVAVDKTGVLIRYLQGDNAETAFLMRPNGYAYLTVEQQEAMRAVLEECLPKLCDQSRYHVSRKRIRLLNGDIEYAYHYTITNAYKTQLCHALNHDGTLQQTRSW